MAPSPFIINEAKALSNGRMTLFKPTLVMQSTLLEASRFINRINDHNTDTNGGTMFMMRDDKIFASFLF